MTRLVRAEEVLAEHLADPAFRADWERTAPARALALRVIAYRIGLGLTQTQAGRLLDMPQSAVARLEMGEDLPTSDELRRIEEFLNLELAAGDREARQSL